MPRDIPMRQRAPRKMIEEDEGRRAITTAQFPPPTGANLAFRDGYRECISLYALHAPDKRGVGRILDGNRILLEEECLRDRMARDPLARYEGYRQAMKDLRAAKRIR